ncbi:hypothetical protein ScPMuIL_008956, partial [Solemya velum]
VFFPIPAPPEESPCKRFYCAFGAMCMVNASNEAFCKCPDFCTDVFAPVCGSDDITYSNECELEEASCLTQRRIKVMFSGECGKTDPCEGMDCYDGAVCVPSKDGNTARCMCIEQCYDYGDSVGRKLVCGDDGQEYASRCELQKASCAAMRDIKVKYYGKCDPCDKMECPQPQVCMLDDDRQPVCRCNLFCPNEFKRVCGTDARTYSNECILRREACKTRREISKLHDGPCSNVNPCETHACHPLEHCMIDSKGIANCECPTRCEAVLRPVCGTDDEQYDNLCELNLRACANKEKNISLANSGPCGSKDLCKNHQCDLGAECRVRGNKPKCVCPHCSDAFEPVCGSDGRSYTNECHLRYENCEKKTNIRIAHSGLCDGCQDQRCEFYAVCESDGKQASCVCPTDCVRTQAKVCGTDGKTYMNECKLRVASCRQQKFIKISTIGECDLCAGKPCKFGAHCEQGRCVCPLSCPDYEEPVCASNGDTFFNECDMHKYSCMNSEELDVVHMGDCGFSGSGDLEGSGDEMDECDDTRCKYGGQCRINVEDKYECVCDFQCDNARSPVCGSDGKTYANQCLLQQEACNQQMDLTVQPSDNCDITREPCDGAEPMTNPKRGRHYDCSRAGGETCPRRSHCDQQFGKCCKLENYDRNCEDTPYGCCADKKTPAPGPGWAGCPDYCQCNPIGSLGKTCDVHTRQCVCKPGVGGTKCDRCLNGYWGLTQIDEDNNYGCLPCVCNEIGSSRDDCQQMTGRCQCKPGYMGQKCNKCQNGELISGGGCDHEPGQQLVANTCSEMTCQYGAVCKQMNGYAKCVCDINCSQDRGSHQTVCGSNGENYASRCTLRRFACRNKENIVVIHDGKCEENMHGNHARLTTPIPESQRSKKTTRDIPELSSKVTNRNAHLTERPPISSDDRIGSGRIEDLCIDDTYCIAPHSRCRLGLCECLEGYIPTMGNTHCSEVIIEPSPDPYSQVPTNPCTINPCINGATCEIDDSLGYRCQCPLGRTGPICKEEIAFTTPSFSGKSYLKLREIQGAEKDLALEIQFMTLNENGIILFSSHSPDGTGDFISLTVKDGFVEFRYDLGSGMVKLRSRYTIKLQEFHRVVARRTGPEGVLIVDNTEAVTDNSPYTSTSLNLATPVYLGFIPQLSMDIKNKIGVGMGLVGCIQTLKIGGKDSQYPYSLSFPAEPSDALDGVDIGECGNNPCQSLPCSNGGTCMILDDEIFECLCQEQFTGENCEVSLNPCSSDPCNKNAICVQNDGGFLCICPDEREGELCEYEKLKKLFVPEFVGSSYLVLPLDDYKFGHWLSVEIWFMATNPDGVVLYASTNNGGLGDFISLNLDGGYLVFMFDLGGGVAKIRSKDTLELDVWHKVIIERRNKDGTLEVDGRTTRGRSQGSMNELNLNREMFVGGFKDKFSIPIGSEIKHFFNGAIQRMYINGRHIDSLIQESEEKRNIHEFGGPPCNINPCMNGGVCVARLDNADCRCPKKYMGNRCERLAEALDTSLPIKFDGSMSLKYQNEGKTQQTAQRTNNFHFRFRSNKDNGLILFQNSGISVKGDYLAIAMVDGKIEFSYNLGKQTDRDLHIIRSLVKVSDGQWHTANIQRDSRVGSLQVDEEAAIIDQSTDGATQLDTDGLLWLGGKRELPWGLPTEYYNVFEGCITDMYINDEKLKLFDDIQNKENSKIEFCK